MAVFKEQIASRTKGSMGESEDWWHLCYDPETERFFVEHSWSYVKLNNLSKGAASGTEQHPSDSWTGEGADKIEAAKAKLIAQANGR